MTDTRWWSVARQTACFTLLLAGTAFDLAHAAPPRDRVLWVRDLRVYVALSENAKVAEGDSARFDGRGTFTAAGRVATVLNGEMAVVSIEPGAFARAGRKLDRIRVTFTHAPLARLRVALPRDGRNNLLVRCTQVSPMFPPGTAYRAENAGSNLIRWIVEPSLAHAWPDTLELHFFDDAADEEIALERSDVDVAIFWPGELSERMRRDPRWSRFPLGVLARGVLAITGPGAVADAAGDPAIGPDFNDTLFRSDLVPRSGFAPPAAPLDGANRALPWLFDVDSTVAGRPAIEPWLARFNKMHATRSALLPRARLTFRDAPGDTSAAEGFQPIYRVGCPVVSNAEQAPAIEALGAGALVNLMQCSGAPR